jgi:hypothetical protein
LLWRPSGVTLDRGTGYLIFPGARGCCQIISPSGFGG